MEKITNFYPKLRECDLWNEMLYANRSNRQGLKAAKAEGILIVLIFNFLQTNATTELHELGLEGV